MQPDLRWFPKYDSVVFDHAGKTFIELRVCDHGFARLCGVRLQHNSFMEELLAGIKQACDVAVRNTMEEYADLTNASRAKLRAERQRLFDANADKLPPTIRLPYDGAPNDELTVKFERDNRRAIPVMLDGRVDMHGDPGPRGCRSQRRTQENEGGGPTRVQVRGD